MMTWTPPLTASMCQRGNVQLPTRPGELLVDRLLGVTWPAPFCPSDKVQRVLGLGLLLGDHGAADRHDGGDDAIDALGALVLGRLEVAGGVLGDRDVGGHPAGHRIAAMGEPCRCLKLHAHGDDAWHRGPHYLAE